MREWQSLSHVRWYCRRGGPPSKSRKAGLATHSRALVGGGMPAFRALSGTSPTQQARVAQAQLDGGQAVGPPRQRAAAVASGDNYFDTHREEKIRTYIRSQEAEEKRQEQLRLGGLSPPSRHGSPLGGGLHQATGSAGGT